MAQPILVANVGGTAFFEDGFEVYAPSRYDPLTIPKSLIGQVSGGGLADQESPTSGEPFPTNEREVVLPPFPQDFEMQRVGLEAAFSVFEDQAGKISMKVDLTRRGPMEIRNTSKPMILTKTGDELARNARLMLRQEEVTDSSMGAKIERVIPGIPGDYDRGGGSGYTLGTHQREDLPPLLMIAEVKKIVLKKKPPLQVDPAKTRVLIETRVIENSSPPHSLTTSLPFTSSAPTFSSSTSVPSHFGVLTEAQFQIFIRHYRQKAGIDLFTAPSVLAENQMLWRFDAFSEVTFPIAHDPPKIPDGLAATNFSDSEPGVSATPTEFTTTKTGVHFVTRPTILPDGMIELKIVTADRRLSEMVKFGDRIFSVDGHFLAENEIQAPVFQRSLLATTVRIPTQTIVCLGGAHRQQTVHFIKSVPLLSDIPFFGRLWKSAESEIETRATYFFFRAEMQNTAGFPVP